MKTVRETTIEYSGKEFTIHPAGSGNPESDRITELICENIPHGDSTALIECGTGVIGSFVENSCTCYHTNWIDCYYAELNIPDASHHCLREI